MAIRAELIEQDRAGIDLDRDRALVLRYQQGDEAAFDELYRRYYPRLHLYCQRRVGDRHAAEELAQEAFIRALRAMPRFAGERRFYPWMTVIAQRLCIDHHRRSNRVEPKADIDPGSVEPDHDALFAAVDAGHLAEAMTRVAPRHREVLSLREHEGWSYLEIAAHLDVPVTTVEALLHRARKALRREFLSVSSGTRLAGVPLVGAAFANLGRWRARLSSGGWVSQHAAQLAPIAVAGIAAIGFALAPSGTASTPQIVTTEAGVASPVVVADSAAEPVVLAAPTAAAVVGTEPVAEAPAAADEPPAPTTDLGAAQIYTDQQAVDYWNQQIDSWPTHVTIGPIANVGVDPKLIDAINQLLGGAQ